MRNFKSRLFFQLLQIRPWRSVQSSEHCRDHFSIAEHDTAFAHRTTRPRFAGVRAPAQFITLFYFVHHCDHRIGFAAFGGMLADSRALNSVG
jgi:hypothetical protein